VNQDTHAADTLVRLRPLRRHPQAADTMRTRSEFGQRESWSESCDAVRSRRNAPGMGTRRRLKRRTGNTLNTLYYDSACLRGTQSDWRVLTVSDTMNHDV